jgi:penicillin-binding protein 1C
LTQFSLYSYIHKLFPRRLRKNRILGLIIILFLLFIYYLSLPSNLFTDPFATVLVDRNNHLLGARIADDGQWRFPQTLDIPPKFEAALIQYEDRSFRYHPGVNPFSIGRAILQNLSARKVVSGGSTLSMQLIRLHRKNKKRTLWEKIIETVLATRLEFRYSKSEILQLYASHAPFGGNVVGIEAACWRYFGREPEELSWGEAALLAVLPNNPSLIHPGRNRDRLLRKRNKLLTSLFEQGKMDSMSLSLAFSEPIPEKPLPLPSFSSHLLDRAIKEGYSGRKTTSTLDIELQKSVEEILLQHHRKLRENEVWNAAALILDTNTGQVLAYVGNARESIHNHEVDIVNSPRSSGSILKPFLYAAMLDEGLILPQSLIPDIPIVIDGFAPRNFSKQYDGAVPAHEALVKSLNIPAVLMLRDYRYERFYDLLKKMKFSTFTKNPDHYGLSMILGGAEAKLWDIGGMYASMGRVVNRYYQGSSEYKYHTEDFHEPVWRLEGMKSPTTRNTRVGVLSASALWQTLDVLTEVNRPDDENGWKNFAGKQKISWKTGTSYGHRDAWAVGLTPSYTVAIWVGNASGEGRSGLTGVLAAAPLMFDVFSILSPSEKWFQLPVQELKSVEICPESGYLAGPICPEKKKISISPQGMKANSCPNHQIIHLDLAGKFQVHAGCEPLDKIVTKSWFVLPPTQEYYFKTKHFNYQVAPPFRTDCQGSKKNEVMEIIYPRKDAKIYIPKLLDGNTGEVAFQVAHNQSQTRIFWHLNGEFLGATLHDHQMSFYAPLGLHTLVIVDENGESLIREFEIIN